MNFIYWGALSNNARLTEEARTHSPNYLIEEYKYAHTDITVYVQIHGCSTEIIGDENQ